MRYVPAHRLRDDERGRTAGCDGLCGTGLDLSHWPGNRTPARFQADLSTEIALRFAASEEHARWELCTNNHYDADGVLSLFACCAPDEARALRDLLVAAAAFGDFGEGADERALMLAATLDGLRASPRSPLAPQLARLDDADADAFVTEHVLRGLPGIAGDLARFEPLWRDERAWFERSRDAVRSGALVVTDLAPARLTVVEGAERAHPAVAQGAGRGELFLHCVRHDDGWAYRAEWRGYSWADTVSPQRPRLRTVSLEKLCLPLNSLEPAAHGRWLAEGYPQGMTEAMRFTDAQGRALRSGLAPDEVVEKLAWFLVERRAG
jgi:hypothetical protein